MILRNIIELFYNTQLVIRRKDFSTQGENTKHLVGKQLDERMKNINKKSPGAMARAVPFRRILGVRELLGGEMLLR
jgi:hypothetical protein